MKPIQNKISKIVEKYIKNHYSEYVSVCESIKDQREVQNDEFASTGDSKSYLGQLAMIIPETLHNLLQDGLDEEEWKYYTSKVGTEWFAKAFSEFSPAIKI